MWGDLRAAQAQVDEARRHATPATLTYIDLWESLIRDERRRRRGERISRTARLQEIQKEYTRIIFARDPITPPVEIAMVLVAAAAVLGRLTLDQIR